MSPRTRWVWLFVFHRRIPAFFLIFHPPSLPASSYQCCWVKSPRIRRTGEYSICVCVPRGDASLYVLLSDLNHNCYYITATPEYININFNIQIDINANLAGWQRLLNNANASDTRHIVIFTHDKYVIVSTGYSTNAFWVDSMQIDISKLYLVHQRLSGHQIVNLQDFRSKLQKDIESAGKLDKFISAWEFSFHRISIRFRFTWKHQLAGIRVAPMEGSRRCSEEREGDAVPQGCVPESG